MGSSFLSTKDFGLPAFVIAFLLTIVLFKLSSLLAAYGLYFQWSTFFNYSSDDPSYNLWVALVLRFLIPAAAGLLASLVLVPDMRSSVTAGVFFAALFLVWPAILDFENVVAEPLVVYKPVFFCFYGLYVIFFPLAAYGGFSLGAWLAPFMPHFRLQPGETIKLSLGKHILLPAAISLSGNLIASAALRDFAMRVLGAK
jgi:hypothetical protein